VVASSLAAQANTLHVSEKAASLDVLPASPTRAYVTISQVRLTAVIADCADLRRPPMKSRPL
jgi:hypothetical protein